jgi:hypothetical protein
VPVFFLLKVFWGSRGRFFKKAPWKKETEVIMKQLTGFILFFLLVMNTLAGTSIKHLKGITYARTRCEWNGVSFYRGYTDPLAEKAREFNLDEAENALKEAQIPLDKKNILAVHAAVEAQLKVGGIRIVEIKQSDNEENSSATVLPTIELHFNITPLPGETGEEAAEEEKEPHAFIASIDLTVSRSVSAWYGAENVQAPMIAWWQKKMLTIKADELNESLDGVVKELLEEFLARWREADTPPETESPANEEKTDEKK